MRWAAVGVLSLSLLPGRAFALTEVTTKEQIKKRERIAELFREMAAYQAERGKLQRELVTLRTQIEPDLVKLRALAVMQRVVEDEILTRGNEAVRLTVDVYGIKPPGPPRSITSPGDNQGKAAPWNVIYWNTMSHESFGELETTRRRPLGVTWSDGTIQITERALLSPGVLAATIVHESVHYNQRTLQYPTRLSPFDREQAARGFAMNDEVQRILGLTAADRKYLEGAYQEFLADPGAFVPLRNGKPEQMVVDDQPNEFAIDAEAVARMRRRADDIRRSIDAESVARARQGVGRRGSAMNEHFRSEIVQDAMRCGFYPKEPERWLFNVWGRSEYLVMRFPDADGAHVGLLLASACANPIVRDASCGNWMEPLARRWGEKDFRRDVVPGEGSDEYLVECVRHMGNKLKPTSDYEKVRELAAKFKKKWDKDHPASQPRNPPSVRTPSERERPDPQPPETPHCRYQGDWCKDPRRK